MESAVIIAIVGVAALYLVRRFVRQGQGKEGCGCSCSGCPSSQAGQSGCCGSIANSPDDARHN